MSPRCRVNLDYHVEIERLNYSVPFQLLRQTVFRQRWTASSERWTASIQNAGRHQFTMLDAISSERLDGLPQDPKPIVAA